MMNVASWERVVPVEVVRGTTLGAFYGGTFLTTWTTSGAAILALGFVLETGRQSQVAASVVS